MKMATSVKFLQDKPGSVAIAATECSKSPFFEGLTQLEIRSILAAGTLRQYPARSIVLNQGDPAEVFLLLRTGCARLFIITEQGRKVVLRWLPPGEILGGAALLSTPASYVAGTEMIKDSSVFVWRRDTIRRLATQYPRLLENALPFALDHLTWFVAAHLALVSSTARERLVQVLLSFAKGIGHKFSDGIVLEMTNEQLANAANITQFTASRFLSEWQRTGVIVKSRGKLTLRSPHRLFLHEV